MITYDVEEEELEPDPADKFAIKECPIKFPDGYLRALTPTRYRGDQKTLVGPKSLGKKTDEDLSDLIRRIVKEEIEKVLPRIVTCINDGPSDLEFIIREEVRSNLTPLTREKLAPSPYRTRRTGESYWRPRPRPRQEKTNLTRYRKEDLPLV
ncbi:uncharacterized protein TNCV_4090531 [Trichonephila clavipes]|uniref:Uncharacterized protein n=1 Tax=Trichonephila clavipes TaxID=2585209 RepID=A0A8X6SEF3_TRICX|nr:uncharacterized protein TNCV_4090531 [Trichonephila clavipes]